jgi:hypothetical protein
MLENTDFINSLLASKLSLVEVSNLFSLNKHSIHSKLISLIMSNIFLFIK